MTPQERDRYIGMIASHLGFTKIEDLAAHFAKTVGIRFADPRRPSSDELERANRAIESDREFMALMSERGHPVGQMAKAMRQLVYGLRYDPPTDAAGQPLPLDVPALPAGRDKGTPEFAFLTAEEASDRIAWAERNPEYGAIVGNAEHEQHEAFAAQIAELRSIGEAQPATAEGRLADAATPPAAASPSAPATAPAGAVMPAQRQAQRAKLQADPRYRSRAHPEHAAAVEEMRALYHADHPDRTPVTALPGEPQQIAPNTVQAPGPVAPASPAPAAGAPAKP